MVFKSVHEKSATQHKASATDCIYPLQFVHIASAILEKYLNSKIQSGFLIYKSHKSILDKVKLCTENQLLSLLLQWIVGGLGEGI